MTDTSYTYNAKVIRWVDGDTVWLVASKTTEIDYGFRVKVSLTVGHELEFRVYGIDTPEDNAGKPAKARVNELAPVGSNVDVDTFKPNNSDKYGRWLADITTPSGVNITAELISEHLGVPYFGGKKQ